jgi:hypothetical protein
MILFLHPAEPSMPDYQAGLCAIVKDEDLYLEEWLHYHRLLGFEHFILFDNESARPLRDTLRHHIESGLVTVHEVAGRSMQIPSYRQCLQQHGARFRWLAFFDLDEFLVLKAHQDVRLFLAEYNDYAAVALHWVPFGSGGHIVRPHGLVIENYTQTLRDEQKRLHVKCIVRPDRTTDVRDPHCFRFCAGSHCVDENRMPVTNALAPFTAGTAQLNHYHYKSQQDYEEKMNKGRADNFALSSSRSLQEFYEQAAEDGAKDYTALRRAPLVHAAVKGPQTSATQHITLRQVNGMKLYEIVERIRDSLTRGDAAGALLYVILAEERYGQVPEYLHAATLALLAAGRPEAALATACTLIRVQPSAPSYYQLFLTQLKNGQKEAAAATGLYLKHTYAIFNMPPDATLAELQRHDKALGLGIWPADAATV